LRNSAAQPMLRAISSQLRDRGKRGGAIMDKREGCKECLSLVGLSGTRTPHKQLHAPTAERGASYNVARFQTLYACSECHSMLITGRNTGWAFASRIQA
jgi:hypothetical protein